MPAYNNEEKFFDQKLFLWVLLMVFVLILFPVGCFVVDRIAEEEISGSSGSQLSGTEASMPSDGDFPLRRVPGGNRNPADVPSLPGERVNMGETASVVSGEHATVSEAETPADAVPAGPAETLSGWDQGAGAGPTNGEEHFPTLDSLAGASVRIDGALINIMSQTEVPQSLFGVTGKLIVNDALIKSLGIQAVREGHQTLRNRSHAVDENNKLIPRYENLEVLVDSIRLVETKEFQNLSNRNFVDYLQKAGRTYASGCKLAGWSGTVEIVNRESYEDAEDWQNLAFYEGCLKGFAKGVKSVEGAEVDILTTWNHSIQSTRSFSDGLERVDVLDSNIDFVSGFSHRPTADTAELYEVIAAYTIPKHNKLLMGYDVGHPDKSLKVDGVKTSKQYDNARYLMGNILQVAYFCPSKVGARIADVESTDSAVAKVYRLFRDLRGPMVHTKCRPGIWAVSCMNDARLTNAIYNTKGSAQRMRVAVAAPKGAYLGRAGIVQFKEVDGNMEEVAETIEPIEKNKNGYAIYEIQVPAREAVVLKVQLGGPTPTRPQIFRKQFFAKEGALMQLAGKPVDYNIKVDQDFRPSDKVIGVTLRLVLRGMVQGVEVSINDQTYSVPDGPGIVEIPMDPEFLRKNNVLSISYRSPGSKRGVISAVSLLVDTMYPNT